MNLRRVVIGALGYILGLSGATFSLPPEPVHLPGVYLPGVYLPSVGLRVREQPWKLPTPLPLRLGRAFDPPEHNWLSGHRGVDLCPGVGTPIRAPTAGIVIYAGRLNDRDLVSLQLPNGLRTSFEPLQVQVAKGQYVSAGEVLGVLEPGHDGDCLHWGVRAANGRYLNPLQFLVGRARLLPWTEPGQQAAN